MPVPPVSAVRIALVDETVALSDVEWRADVDGIEVRELVIDERRWALVRYAPGARREEWCADGHLGVVLSGQIEYEFEDGGSPVVAQQGDALTLSTGRGHRGRNGGETVTTLLVIDDPVTSPDLT
jgi:quercetin dioxygenase-like cupin family protein